MTNDKNSINVALFGISPVISALAQGNAAQHQTQFPRIGSYDTGSLRFSSAFILNDDDSKQVLGWKLSEVLMRDGMYDKQAISKTTLGSYMEMTGGNPNTVEGDEMSMGGQNPFVRRLPWVKDDKKQLQINTESLEKILLGECEDGFNPYLKADIAILSPSNTEEDEAASKIADFLIELEIPFVWVPVNRSATGLPVSDALPHIVGTLQGPVGHHTLTDLIEQLEERGLTIRENFDTINQCDDKRILSNLYIEGTGFGGLEFSLSATTTVDNLAVSKASALFDVLRFIQVASDHSIVGELEGVTARYTKQNPVTESEANEECQALAAENLMALGQFYRAKSGKMIHI